MLIFSTMAHADLIDVNVLTRLEIFFNILFSARVSFDIQNPIIMAKVQQKYKAVHSIPPS
jgi:hypothetical protein